LECDDGDNDNYDGCSSSCLLEEGFYCYDSWTTTPTGTLDENYDNPTICYEICHDGMRFNDDSTYCDTDGYTHGCNEDCEVVDGWYCINGDYTTADDCFELCGDGYNWGALECDDVGTYLEGCSDDCHVEEGWYCNLNNVVTPSILGTPVT